MKRLFLSFLVLFTMQSMVFAQVNNNGTLDALEEFTSMQTVPIVMPDGIKLMTDIYMPVTRDSMVVDIDIFGTVSSLILIPKGTQFMIYDSVNGQPNPNPFQLPIVLTRTPYNKEGEELGGAVFSIMGYAHAFQDMRGRYSSEGVYMPMYSDSWNKDPYHPDFKHVLDVTDLSDPKNGNKHEDGYNTIKALARDVTFADYYGPDHPFANDPICNGSMGMFGASALGNTQLQAALAHRVKDSIPELKCLFPIVATSEHFSYTGYQNGVFRDRIVTGWLKGQIFDTEDDLIDQDFDVHNDIHTSFDYGLPNKFEAANRAIDHFSTVRYNGDPAGYYPTSRGRADMDASAAPVNEFGQGDANGQYSRYTNMDVPVYHATGWWDIFTDGQIDTWKKTRNNISGRNAGLQKIIIGPWAHQTIGSLETGDMADYSDDPAAGGVDRRYPSTVMDLLKFNIDELAIDNLPISEVVSSDIITWFRYNLNFDPDLTLGEPKFFIPEATVWQEVDFGGLGYVDVKIPAEDVKIPFDKMFNFLAGTGELEGVPVLIVSRQSGDTTEIEIPIPIQDRILDALPEGSNITGIPRTDFMDVDPFRYYVVGPNNDGVPGNENLGNYWKGADDFPITDDIYWTDMFFHQDGSLNQQVPSFDEGYKIYVHDPDDPVLSAGGANMIVRSPDGSRNSQGQIEISHPSHAPYCMDRAGVISFETEPIKDSLCIIGYPKTVLYAKTNPGGTPDGDPTDTDFFVRILDVYPDGKEYFVVEGCVNARAREFARHIYDNFDEDRNQPFSNIEAGKIYEYAFQLMPIAYTFGKDHKMKVLISSSNYTRYQVNANLPMEDGDFFRRKPGDGRSYTFNGVEMEPRVAVQRIHFSPEHPSKLELPVYSKVPTSVEQTAYELKPSVEVEVYPNPTADFVNLYVNTHNQYEAVVRDLKGQELERLQFTDNTRIDMSDYQSGMYSIEVIDVKDNKMSISKQVSRL